MANEVYQLKIIGSLNGQYRENVLSFEGLGVDSNDTWKAANDLLGAWNTHLKALWLSMFPATYSIERLEARRIQLKPSAVVKIQKQFNAEVGARGTNATAQQTCPMVFMVPSMGTFSGGKIFLPCVPQSDIINSTYAAAWITVVAAFFTQAIGSNGGPLYSWNLGVWSRKHHTFSNVLSFHLSPAIGFIHRRKLQSGKGAHKKKP